MGWKRKVGGSVIGFVGFMLSPLSWWNDLFVNIPLAVAFAWLVAFFYPPAFKASVIFGYWLTNVVGLILLHKGGQMVLTEQKPLSNRRRLLLVNLGVSLGYTLLIVLLAQLKILKPVTDYFGGK